MQSAWLLHSLFPTQEIAAVSCYSQNCCGIAAGRRGGSSALQGATELGQTSATCGGTPLGLSDTQGVYHQSFKNDLILSMFTRPLLALYLTAVIYPRSSGSAPALADTLLFCRQFTFERNFLNLFAKGYFCISLCVKCSILVFLHTLWLSMDVLLVCIYLGNIKLFQKIFFISCSTFSFPV